MSLLPPIINDSLFNAIKKSNPEVLRVFDPIIQELHQFLNDLPCLRGLQEARHQALGIRPRYSQAFGSRTIKQGQWYTFNHGGRNEMQFNIGMCGSTAKSPGYLRVGLAWNFYGHSRRILSSSFESFRDLIAREDRSWDEFANTNRLEIESMLNYKHPIIKKISANNVTEWLSREKFTKFDWIFIGRLLRRGVGTVILDDPIRLKNVIESVFSGFLPFWEKTQHMAHARDLRPVS
ncbi:MAG: hypothetical protein PHI34_03515 [Acidobacteriota bacterium]|nr:hypothetical protein [Acidobacteriota bacterium]